MKIYPFFTGILILILVGCSGENIIYKSDTAGKYTINVEIVPGTDGNKYSGLIKKALTLFKSRVKLISDQEAELARLNRDRGPQPMSQDFKELLTLTIELSEITGGNWSPYMGKPRELWQFDASEPTTPSASFLYEAVEQSQNTQLKLHAADKAQLTGNGTLYLDNLAIGWAIDGAADILIKGGVESGKISVGHISRFWGSPQDSAWSFLISSHAPDSTKYKITPTNGAIAIIDLETDGFIHREKMHYEILSPESGLPISEPLGCAVWAPKAAEASAYVEAIALMGLTEGFKWVELHEDISAMYLFPTGGTYAIHMDPLMSPWVTTVLQR